MLLTAFLLAAGARALTLPDRTEHLGMRVLPAPGEVTVDGKFDDWDLSGGIFACKSISRYRERFACWFHVMYDAHNIYVLTRWNDPTPMNNPESANRGTGFDGDGLQLRFIIASGTPRERVSHVTAWHGSADSKHVVNITYGRRFNEGQIRDAQTLGAKQAFLKRPDGRGYDQEISLPWKLLTKDRAPLKAGGRFVITIQPNFSYGRRGRSRLFIADVFKHNMSIDRATIYQDYHCWAGAVLLPKGNVEPWPVRVADGRRFVVKMEDGAPVVDWKTLVIGDEPSTVIMPPGIEPVHHLTVQSEPIAGLKITGDHPGRTNYTAVCGTGETVRLIAPSHAAGPGKQYDFLRWKLDGNDGPDGLLKAEITLDMNRVATAVYAIRTHRLTVRSTPIAGVAVSGDNKGVTDYMTLCTSEQQVSLTAPKSQAADGKRYDFVRWVVDGQHNPDGLTWIRIRMDMEHIVTAVYQARTPANGKNAENKAIPPPDRPPAHTVSASPGWAVALVGLAAVVLACAALLWLLWGRRRAG